MKEKLLERFLRYVAVTSQSNAKAGVVPSTEGQRRLAELLAEELRELGLEKIEISEKSVLTAHLPSNGGDICLNAEKDIWLRTADHPEVNDYIGDDLVVTDGTSVLGADNKSAIANVMTSLETVIRENRPHGDIYVAFVPDEEIGLLGAKAMDFTKFPVDYAYTIDCCAVGEVVYETFNAGGATLSIRGVTAHPMSSKGVLVNPALIATDFINMLDRGSVHRRDGRLRLGERHSGDARRRHRVGEDPRPQQGGL